MINLKFVKIVLLSVVSIGMTLAAANAKASFDQDSALSSRAVGSPSQKLSPIILSDATTQSLCPNSKPQEACLVNWAVAVSYCKSNGGHLPTAREYAVMLRGLGTVTLEPSEVATQFNSQVPAHYYLVASENEDGSRDAFYMNHESYQRVSFVGGDHLLWTASTPPAHAQYAHVYYDSWGGGGGEPGEHLKSRLNSFQCVQSN